MVAGALQHGVLYQDNVPGFTKEDLKKINNINSLIQRYWMLSSIKLYILCIQFSNTFAKLLIDCFCYRVSIKRVAAQK